MKNVNNPIIDCAFAERFICFENGFGEAVTNRLHIKEICYYVLYINKVLILFK